VSLAVTTTRTTSPLLSQRLNAMTPLGLIGGLDEAAHTHTNRVASDGPVKLGISAAPGADSLKISALKYPMRDVRCRSASSVMQRSSDAELESPTRQARVDSRSRLLVGICACRFDRRAGRDPLACPFW
jgi:hypothetical protein